MSRRFLAIGLIVGIMLPSMLRPAQVQGGSHPLTEYRPSTGGQSPGELDLVVSLTWNPTAVDRSAPNGRLYVALKELSRSIYVMTEGKHKIGKIYVFADNAQMQRADIRVMGRYYGVSNANTNGFPY